MRPILSLLSYVLLVFGFLSMVLGMIGLNLTPLSFMDRIFTPGLSMFIKLILFVIGLILLYITRTYKEEDFR